MALMQTLTDNFATKNESKWIHNTTTTPWQSGETIVGGKLDLVSTSGYTSELQSAIDYDMTNSYAFVSIEQRNSQGGDNSSEMSFDIRTGANIGNKFEFILTGAGGITYDQYVGGVNNGGGGFTTYNATTMKYLRFFHNGTSMLMQYAAQAAGPWTTFQTFTPAFAVTAMRPYFNCGFYGTQATPGSAQYDNFNFDPAAVTTRSDLFFNFLGA